MDFLTLDDICKKYNRSPALVCRWAVINNVPYDVVKIGVRLVRLYKFYPRFETLFAARHSLKKTRGSSNLKICVVLHPFQGGFSPLVFKSFLSAWFYLKKSVSPPPIFLAPHGIHFKSFYSSLSPSLSAKVDAFLRDNKNCSRFAVCVPPSGGSFKLFNVSSVRGQTDFLKYFFLRNNKRVTVCFQNENESSLNFRKRIFAEDGGDDGISRSVLRSLFPSPEPSDDF